MNLKENLPSNVRFVDTGLVFRRAPKRGCRSGLFDLDFRLILEFRRLRIIRIARQDVGHVDDFRFGSAEPEINSQ